MKFHLAPLSLTLSVLERSMQVRHISEGRHLETLAETAKFIINDGYRKSYIPFHLLLLTLT